MPIKDKYLQRTVDEIQDDGYLLYHAPRYDRLLELLHQYHQADEPILDIGRTTFVEIACQSLNTRVNTLGFEDDKETDTGFNYHFDLNAAQNKSDWRQDIPRHQIILLAEVIEHVHTSPKLVLQFLRTLLKKDGFLIIQTPNAVALHKRLKMIFGKNPYLLMSEDIKMPSHFREYTVAELTGYCKVAGYRIKQRNIENYFDYRYRNHPRGSSDPKPIYGWINKAYRFLPGNLCPGLCFVIQNK
jgi:SAM-dependent methyltransferase